MQSDTDSQSVSVIIGHNLRGIEYHTGLECMDMRDTKDDAVKQSWVVTGAGDAVASPYRIVISKIFLSYQSMYCM